MGRVIPGGAGSGGWRFLPAGGGGGGTGGLTPPANYTSKTFSDYFLGNTLNTGQWYPGFGDNYYGPWYLTNSSSPLTSANGNGNPADGNDAEYMSPAQITVNNGLTLTAQKSTAQSGYSWVSGMIRTTAQVHGSAGQSYAQCRLFVPPGAGCWAGFWGQIAAANPPGANSETDVLESGYGSGTTPPNNIVQTTVHWVSGSSGTDAYVPGIGNITTGYHIYGWEYNPGQWMKFYFDGTMYKEWTSSNGAIPSAPYDIKINLQMANSNALGFHPPVNGTTPSPSQVLCSGVEVWQGFV